MPEQVSAPQTKREPSSPVPLSPRDATVVNGNEVTFAWESVSNADEYVIQVASDAKFSDVVMEENVGGQTAVTVADFFPTDERTYFWRVFGVNDSGYSPGERVESFVSATQDEADVHLPTTGEDLGPVTELVRAAGADARAELTMSRDEDTFEREVETGVAEEGIPSAQIAAIAVSILVTMLVLASVVFSLVSGTSQEAREAAISADDYTELQETETEAARQLNQYDVVSEEEGVYRIPIERAMDLMADEAYQEQQRESVAGTIPVPDTPAADTGETDGGSP
jgi:hypothetical protein